MWRGCRRRWPAAFRRGSRALRLPGLRRQTKLETLTFRLWFLLG